MPRLRDPDSGLHKVVSARQEPRYRAAGWVDFNSPASDPSDGRPSAADPKHAWIAYAEQQGDDEAELRTKRELMDLYGG